MAKRKVARGVMGIMIMKGCVIHTMVIQIWTKAIEKEET